MIGTVQDITERKRREAKEESLETKLRQFQKMEAIGTLAGGIAHDFNNILTSIIGYSELLATKILPETREHSYLNQIIDAGNLAKELMKQILAFCRQAEQE
jgi:signal transduction histidine kinase